MKERSISNNTSSIIDTLNMDGEIYYRIKDEKSRWFNSIIRLTKSEYEQQLTAYTLGYYKNYDENWRRSAALNSCFYKRPIRVYNKKSQELKYDVGKAVWLDEYKGPEEIIFQKPEDRVNVKDLLDNQIVKGSTVISSDEYRTYIGTVDHFKVGPRFTYVRVKAILPTSHSGSIVSCKTNNTVVVTSDFSDKVIIAKLSG